MQEIRNSHKNIVVYISVWLITILWILCFWMILPQKYKANENYDYFIYYKPVAENILRGEGLTFDGHLALAYPPGYPIILSIIFKISDISGISRESGLNIFMLISVSFASLFIFYLSKKIWEPPFAFIPCIGILTYPPFLWLTKQPNSETVFITLFYLAVAIFWNSLLSKKNYFKYFLVGALLGLIALIRPIALILSLIFCIFLWFCSFQRSIKLKLLLILIILSGNLLAILPWEYLVYRQTDKIIILSAGGLASIKDGLTFAVDDQEGRRQGVQVSKDVEAIMQTVHDNKESLSSKGDILALLKQLYIKDPAAVWKLILLKIKRCWYATNTQRYEGLLLKGQLLYIAVFFLATIASLLSKDAVLIRFTIFSWSIVIYFWLMAALVLPLLRYLVPSLGLLFILIPAIFNKNILRAKLNNPRRR